MSFTISAAHWVETTVRDWNAALNERYDEADKYCKPHATIVLDVWEEHTDHRLNGARDCCTLCPILAGRTAAGSQTCALHVFKY